MAIQMLGDQVLVAAAPKEEKRQAELFYQQMLKQPHQNQAS